MFQTIGAFNVITDVALILLSCGVLWTVQVSMVKRLRIISLLAIRLVYVALPLDYHNELKGDKR